MRRDARNSPAASAAAAIHHDTQNYQTASTSSHGYPSSSLASSLASTTCTSDSSSSQVWSDSLSQASDDSSASSATSDSDSCASQRRRQLHRGLCVTVTEQQHHTESRTCSWTRAQNHQPSLHIDVPVAVELRQNPRRSSSRTACPPPLVRQADRKVNFVDNLVDSSTQIVEAIWPTSSVICHSEASSSSVLPLRTFIQETLRRSRTSYSTLQVALYYMILIKPHIPEHDFTMEQPRDCHASRALQCGRRMFLAALILASKYLQDRNYSARAWSKISGLATQEINQNEMAFLLAVNWNLHITNEIYTRWTECVMKFTPSQPPSPGGAAQMIFERQCEDFRHLILNLTPDLKNLELLVPQPTYKPAALLVERASSPRSLYSAWPADKCPSFGRDATEGSAATPMTPTHYSNRNSNTPMVMEPTPATVYTPGRLAPALGLLPTPRLTPQSSAFSTPAASAAGHSIKGSSMGLAMAQSGSATATQAPWAAAPAPWPTAVTSSPHSYFTARRSSLATTVSTASSPESMVSDSSRTSRSSSISSASSLASAPSTKLDVQARCRYAKLCSERSSMRPMIATVPEDYEESHCLSSSPEPYCGEPLSARQERELDDAAAARALQDLHNNFQATLSSRISRRPGLAPRAGSKRGRTASMEITQEQVRELLRQRGPSCASSGWTDAVVRPTFGSTVSEPVLSHAASFRNDGRKRVCCSTEAAKRYEMNAIHPAVGGMGGPGMWDGILN